MKVWNCYNFCNYTRMEISVKNGIFRTREWRVVCVEFTV